jgi:hypothetical protein
LFVTATGKGLSYWGGRMLWRRVQRRSGVKRLGSHLVRHTFAQTIARKGAPIADIQDVLGEAQPCQLDRPVQLEQPATFVLMVLPPDLVVLPRVGGKPVGPNTVNYEFKAPRPGFERGTYLPVNSLM